MLPFLVRYVPLFLFALTTLALLILMAIALGRFLYDRQTKQKTSRKRGQLPEDAGIRDLIAQGKMDAAIDLYQQFTGVDIFTAKDAVEQMAAEHRLSLRDDALRMVLAERGKAAAIQAYQEDTGADFDAALKHVERLEKAQSKR